MLKILLGFESWDFFFLFIHIYTYIDLWKICGGGRWKATGNGAALFFLIPAREDIFIDTSFDGFPFICIIVFFCCPAGNVCCRGKDHGVFFKFLRQIDSDKIWFCVVYLSQDFPTVAEQLPEEESGWAWLYWIYLDSVYVWFRFLPHPGSWK